MTNDQQPKWDEEMQVRVFGAAPADDYNFKTAVYPKYSTESTEARKLVDKINQSGRYHIKIDRVGGAEYAAEVLSADGDERLSRVQRAREASAICEAIVAADVKL